VTNNDNGTFTFNPGATFQDLSAGATRDITFSYTANDNSGAGNAASSTSTVTISIIGTNDQPLVSNVSISATEDGSAVIGSFVGTDTDSSDTLSFAVIGSPSEGSVVNNNDGSFSFDPGSDFQDLAAGETRDVNFNYAATDSSSTGNATSLTGTVNITVTGVDETNSTQLASFTNLDFRGARGFLPQNTAMDAASIAQISNSTSALTGISTSLVLVVDSLDMVQSYGDFAQTGEQSLVWYSESAAHRIFIDGNTSLLISDPMALEVLRTDGSASHSANSIDETLPGAGLDDFADTSRDAGSETASLHLTGNVDLSGIQNLKNFEELHLANDSLATSQLNTSDVLNIISDNNLDALLDDDSGNAEVVDGDIGDELILNGGSLSNVGSITLAPYIAEISTCFAVIDSGNKVELLVNALLASYE